MALTNGFSNIALDSSVQDVKTLQEEIRDLNDNLLIILAAIFERMPRVTGNDQAAVSIEAGSVGISAAQTLATVTTVGTVTTTTTVGTVTNQAQIGGQEALTVARNQILSGTHYIYSNLEVS